MSSFIDRIPPVVRVPVRFGLIGGVLGFIVLIILYYVGRHPMLVIPLFDFRVALFGILMFFTLKELRDYYFKGLLFFYQAIIACGVFVITFAILASLLLWIFAINVPDFVIQYRELATNQAMGYPQEVKDQIGKAMFDATIQNLKTTDAGELAKMYFSRSILIGLFISIILSVILRRQPSLNQPEIKQ